MPTVTVNISDGGAIPTLGENFALTCSITGAEGLTPSNISYLWIGSNRTQVQSIVGSNTIFIPSLELTSAGVYTCVVTINSPYLDYDLTVENSHILVLQREFVSSVPVYVSYNNLYYL